MASGLEPAIGRIAGQVVKKLAGRIAKDRELRKTRDTARPMMAQETAKLLMGELSSQEAAGVASYLSSPDFEQVALHVVIAHQYRSRAAREEGISAAREQIRQGLRLRAQIPPDRLLGITDVVAEALNSAAIKGRGSQTTTGEILPDVGWAHIAASGVHNSELLRSISGLADIDDKLERLRRQISLMHKDLRMPHAGVSRGTPWKHLYVEPALGGDLAAEISALGEAGQRSVILGDPGAGKSTLAEKLAYDLATAEHGTVLPILVVLRHYSAALEAGERTVADYLASVTRDPYNIDIGDVAMSYLLLSGRAVVIFDGLDELTDVSLRRRVTDLIKGFVLLYPLLPVIVTSRRIGYQEAPLDAGLFRHGVIKPFSDRRVHEYANKWFKLDESSFPQDRQGLADSFFRESEGIADLRQNPLLLTLLCAMYSSDHYIPRNRGQVYERCALMVYDRWDGIRGIPSGVGFEGHARGAVQRLAWHLFTGPATELPRERILRVLGDYLIAKGFDDDQAAKSARSFIDYCAGRAWVLTEVGSTEIEPIYGFTHRTFLEYFSAEYLVRHHQTPRKIWLQLAPHIVQGSWDVVASLSLQLIDRNIDNGADLMLAEAFDQADQADQADQVDQGERESLADFAVRSFGDVSVMPATAARIVELFLTLSLKDPEQPLRTLRDRDRLRVLLFVSLPGNVPLIRRALTDEIDRRARIGDSSARKMLSRFFGGGWWAEDDLRRRSWVEWYAELMDSDRGERKFVL